MDMHDYVKNVLITENPVRSMFSSRGDIGYLDQVYDPVANMICHYITDDQMNPHDSIHLALNNEFNPQDIDLNRVHNVVTRSKVLRQIQSEDPVRELSK